MAKILILGATGRTGSKTLEIALDKGYEVVALVRDPAKISLSSDKLTVVKGTPANAQDVANALVGCSAVISVLNNNRTSDNPWAKPVSPEGFMTGAIENCVAAMKEQGVTRITVLSAAGVGDSFERMPWFFRWLVRKTNLSQGYRDHEGQEQVLRESGLQWTAARPVGLSDKPSGKQLIVELGAPGKTSMMIQREHVARFLVDSLEDPATIGKAPLLYEGKNK